MLKSSAIPFASILLQTPQRISFSVPRIENPVLRPKLSADICCALVRAQHWRILRTMTLHRVGPWSGVSPPGPRPRRPDPPHLRNLPLARRGRNRHALRAPSPYHSPQTVGGDVRRLAVSGISGQRTVLRRTVAYKDIDIVEQNKNAAKTRSIRLRRVRSRSA